MVIWVFLWSFDTCSSLTSPQYVYSRQQLLSHCEQVRGLGHIGSAKRSAVVYRCVRRPCRRVNREAMQTLRFKDGFINLLQKGWPSPVGQNRKVSGSPRCLYTALVMATWAWAKELKVCLSAGHISVSMSSNSKEKDLQPNSFTWGHEGTAWGFGECLGLPGKLLPGNFTFQKGCSAV